VKGRARDLTVAVAAVAIAVLAVALLADDHDRSQDDRERSRPAAAREPSGPLAREVGTVPVEMVVQRGAREFTMNGRLDLRKGYRLLARVTGPTGLPKTELWLAGGRGTRFGEPRTYDHIIRFGERRLWTDDHPPTLPLFGRLEPTGAEDYAHLALVALTEGRWDAPFDFAVRDRATPVRDEDNWSMRPLARLAGETRLDLIQTGGRLSGIGFDAPAPEGGAPVRIDLRLLPGRTGGIGVPYNVGLE
jgi:hypothetical protein